MPPPLTYEMTFEHLGIKYELWAPNEILWNSLGISKANLYGTLSWIEEPSEEIKMFIEERIGVLPHTFLHKNLNYLEKLDENIKIKSGLFLF